MATPEEKAEEAALLEQIEAQKAEEAKNEKLLEAAKLALAKQEDEEEECKRVLGCSKNDFLNLDASEQKKTICNIMHIIIEGFGSCPQNLVNQIKQIMATKFAVISMPSESKKQH